MYGILRKILLTPKTVVPTADFMLSDGELTILGDELKREAHKIFGRSLAIREVDAGSTNAEEQELTALSNAYYDLERFGIHFVASPRHADMLMVTGPVSRNMAEGLKRTYDATPDPKIVVAVGDDAIDGGIFKGSYAVLDGVKNVIPVDYEIPGDPPSPKQIISALLTILQKKP
jgi:Ni,Fe-hydrogenase III small subunit